MTERILRRPEVQKLVGLSQFPYARIASAISRAQ